MVRESHHMRESSFDRTPQDTGVRNHTLKFTRNPHAHNLIHVHTHRLGLGVAGGSAFMSGVCVCEGVGGVESAVTRVRVLCMHV